MSSKVLGFCYYSYLLDFFFLGPFKVLWLDCSKYLVRQFGRVGGGEDIERYILKGIESVKCGQLLFMNICQYFLPL